MMEQYSKPMLRQWFDLYRRKLGSVQDLGELEIRSSRLTRAGDTRIQQFAIACEGRFQKAPAKVTLFVVNRGEGWGINGITVSSDVLVESDADGLKGVVSGKPHLK